ncbi:hypothetical protein Tco_1467950 [Tanacetum coccineum]
MESVISCDTAKDTWSDLVHSFKGPFDTKENRIMDLKLEYQTFRAKTFETLSQTYTRYKTLLNELANFGVTLSKHEINVSFINSLLKKWHNLSQRLRNANHTQTLDLADIYGRIFKKLMMMRLMRELVGSTSKIEIWNFMKGSYEEEVSDDEEETRVQVLMALSDDELSVVKNHARNGEWIDITMKKLNILLSMDEDSDWQNYLKYINIDLNEQIPNQKKKIIGGEQLTESSFKNDVKDNPFVPASLDYEHEMVPKFKDWVERLNPDSKLSIGNRYLK